MKIILTHRARRQNWVGRRSTTSTACAPTAGVEGAAFQGVGSAGTRQVDPSDGNPDEERVHHGVILAHDAHPGLLLPGRGDGCKVCADFVKDALHLLAAHALAPLEAIRAAVLGAMASWGGVKLAEGGKPLAQIVIGEYPTKAAQFGAQDLKWHLDKITGANFEIVTDDQIPCNSATLQPCNSITLQLCNPVTLQPCNPATPQP